MRVLLLSAYDAESHRYWHSGLCRNFPDIEWRVLTLPPRYFSWRIRGNSLHWSQTHAQELSESYDLVMATSMVDFATLRGLCPNLTKIPSIVYFHENQLVYPLSGKQKHSVEPAMVNLYSALAADVCLFNSEFNQTSFSTGLEKLLKQFPDFVPQGVTETILRKSKVLPVPLENELFTSKRNKGSGEFLSIVWNHRWEYDKGPDLLLEIINKLPASLALKFHVLGQSFKNSPEAFGHVKALLQKKGYLGEYGYIESRTDYLDLLRRSNCVLSTAVHDFQGLSVLEAIACGCIPIVPKRLAYPEYVPSRYCYGGETQTSGQPRSEVEAQQAVFKILDLLESSSKIPPDPLSVDEYSWSSLKTRYRETFEQTINEFKS